MKVGGGEKCEKNFKMWCSRFILKNNLKNQNQNYFFSSLNVVRLGHIDPHLYLSSSRFVVRLGNSRWSSKLFF